MNKHFPAKLKLQNNVKEPLAHETIDVLMEALIKEVNSLHRQNFKVVST
jgi:hypothetical protein